MVLRMVTFYGPQAAQVNEELPLESYLDLTLTHHLHDEKPELREVRSRIEIKPFRAWYYCIFFELSHLGDFVANRPRF
jgi:hypothetical protein